MEVWVDGAMAGGERPGMAVYVDGVRVDGGPVPPRPYDAKVEYLESTGTQYIDTGVYDADPANIRFEMRRSLFAGMAITSQNNASGTWLGVYRANTQYRVAWHNYNDRYDTTVNPDDQTIKTIVWDGSSGYYEDGVKLYGFTARLGNNGLAGKTWCLFGSVNLTEGFARPFKYGGRVYHLAFSVSGTLVRDFIPVRVGTVGYLYDKVTGQLFGNAGTGSFVLGPDINA